MFVILLLDWNIAANKQSVQISFTLSYFVTGNIFSADVMFVIFRDTCMFMRVIK